jgi:hypothetical protein
MNPNVTAAATRIAATGATAHPRITTAVSEQPGKLFDLFVDGHAADEEQVRAVVLGADYAPPPVWPTTGSLAHAFGRGYCWTFPDGTRIYAADDAALAEAVRRWQVREAQCLWCRLGLPCIHSATRAANAWRS